MSRANPEIFRTYDIRGVAETDLPDEVAHAIGRSYGAMVGSGRAVVVGGDVRISTPRVRAAFIEGVNAAGVDVFDLGMVTTPMLYFGVHHLGDAVSGGVNVTASHNPPEYNGFKLLLGRAALHGEAIQDLAAALETAPTADRPGSVEARDLREAYLTDIESRVTLARPLKVVVDAGNGAGGPFAPEAYRRLGCEVIELYCEPDGNFPNHASDPTVPAAMAELGQRVQEEGADLGIGLDGDADRIGIVDDRGRLAFGDQLMAVFFREVLAARPGAPCIIEVKCSQALVEEVERLGGRPIFHQTGHSLIKATMKKIDAPFTGEMSGHMFFADEFPGYDDAIYAGARFLRLLAGQDGPASALFDSIPSYPSTPELRIGCPDSVKFDVVDDFVETARSEHEILDVDGARVLFSDGWGLVRASNTGPHLILRAEGKTEEVRDTILAYLREKLGRHDEVDLSAVDALL